MESDWVKIFTSTNFHEATIVKAMLNDHEIEVVLLNKQDSSYLNFGEIELYIHPQHFDQAIELIITNENE